GGPARARHRSEKGERARRRGRARPPDRRERRARADDTALCAQTPEPEARHRIALPGRRQWRGTRRRTIVERERVPEVPRVPQVPPGSGSGVRDSAGLWSPSPELRSENIEPELRNAGTGELVEPP